MYAIINISGKQYKTQIGSRLRVPRQKLETGSKVTFEDVLLLSDGENTKFGNPNVKGVSVNAKILNHAREKKVLILIHRIMCLRVFKKRCTCDFLYCEFKRIQKKMYK
mgnify:CR=1 FL=1